MTDIQTTSRPANPPLQWPALIQLVLSLLAAFVLFGAAAIIALSAVIQFIRPSATAQDPTKSFMVAASLVFAGILVLPSAWYAWKATAYPAWEPAPRRERRGFPLVFTLVAAAIEAGALLLGNWAAQNSQVAWFALPPLNVIATGLPALWVIYVGTRGLIPGTPKRLWGVFATGLVLGPVVILILELLLLVAVGLLALLWIMVNPNLANQMTSLVLRLQSAGSNMDAVIRALLPFLANPGIIFIGFAFIAVLVPLIEEGLKPIGVWFLAGQKISPAQGFGYGVLSGAGFGLFENLGNTSGGAEGWALLASSRISTVLLHSFTAGLVGWALVSAWRDRRYLRLGLTYAAAVVIHGLWNGLALLSALSGLQSYTNNTLPTNLPQIGIYSAGGIAGLGVLVLLCFLGANKLLRRTLTSPPLAPAVASPEPGHGVDNPPGESDQTVSPSPGPDANPAPPVGGNPPTTGGETPHLPGGENSVTNTG